MEERGKSALRAKEESPDVHGGRRHLTPPHVNPIWPLQRRTTKKSRSLGRMIRSRMILFQFLHAISPKALELRLVDDDGDDNATPAWRFCENVLTLRAKTEEETRQRVGRLREVQSAALASRGRREHSSAQERIDFDVPLSVQTYRTELRYKRLAGSGLGKQQCRDCLRLPPLTRPTKPNLNESAQQKLAVRRGECGVRCPFIAVRTPNDQGGSLRRSSGTAIDDSEVWRHRSTIRKLGHAPIDDSEVQTHQPMIRKLGHAPMDDSEIRTHRLMTRKFGHTDR